MSDTSPSIIRIDGRYLYAGSERFIARGIIYQAYDSLRRRNIKRIIHFDSLEDNRYDELSRNLVILKDLNINTILVYSCDHAKSHDRCMNLLADHGIYVLFMITGFAPPNKEQTDVDEEVLNNHSKVIDAISRYQNTLGICVAGYLTRRLSRRIESETSTILHNVGFVVRELKRYMRYKNHDTGQRIIPIGIAEEQQSSLHTNNFEYFTKTDHEQRLAGGKIDFYCFSHFDTNNDPLSYKSSDPDPLNLSGILFPILNQGSGWPSYDPTAEPQDPLGWNWKLQLPLLKFSESQNPVPVMISAYGSNVYRPRSFREVRQLYGTNMNSELLRTLSGGFVHRFEDLEDHYGLVTRKNNGIPDTSSAEYANFRDAMAEAVGSKPVDPSDESNTVRMEETINSSASTKV